MQVVLVPFGSYVVEESRDQDFVAFPLDAPDVFREANLALMVEVDLSLTVEAEQLDRYLLTRAAKEAGQENPDIWIFNQEGDMKPIIVANLVKDYPEAADYVQRTMGLNINIQGGDEILEKALEDNVRRWREALPHLPNLRKLVFARVQQESYKAGMGFFNTKSEIAEAAANLHSPYLCKELVEQFFTDGETDPDLGKVYEVILNWTLSKPISTYKSKYGCIGELTEFARLSLNRAYFTIVGEEKEMVYIFWEVVYTYQTVHGVVAIEREVWNKLLELDLEIVPEGGD